MLAVSVVVSLVIVVAWFPATELMHQHRQLATATTQLDEVQHQNQALAQEQHRLKNPAEVSRIARQQYALAAPGGTPYQVLPPTSSKSSPGTAYPTDPGQSAPVAPSGDSELPPGTTSSRAPRGGSASAAAPTFAGRVLQTLEFWR
ncbi:MAG: FtsB family cell division protein [Acidimicrobiales bacterium]